MVVQEFDHFSLFLLPEADEAGALWGYRAKNTNNVHLLHAPVFEIDGKYVTTCPASLSESAPPITLRNEVTEYRYSGALGDFPDLSLEIIFRLASASPVIRFRYRLLSSSPHHLTKISGRDELEYTRLCFDEATQCYEISLSEFNEMLHAYHLQERPVPASSFLNGLALAGPILVGSSGQTSLLLAYEHGSNVPNTYVNFRLAELLHEAGSTGKSAVTEPASPGSRMAALGCGTRSVSLEAVKGNYYTNQLFDPHHPYETIWFQFAAVSGDIDALATAYRTFILNHFSQALASRRPFIFYNTWNYQERNFHWNNRPYLDSMNEVRMLAEIEVAHQVGIDVFVLDTGWYNKTGDWEVDRQRFPNGLSPIKARLDQYGMRLGLWFNPTAAAVTSRLHQAHRNCVVEYGGHETDAFPVWETEDSRSFCLASPYAASFADALIRVNKELGVTYFKWDGVGQEDGCDSPHHTHGIEANSSQERRECWEFELVKSLVAIAERVCQTCPEAIFDLDLTESGRSLGLAFLAAGKYFLINNGPYYSNYDLPRPGTNENLFFYPGPARPALCRQILTYDRWIPSVLFLTHFFPDEISKQPASHWSLPHGKTDSLEVNLASLILGGNGIWGDLLSLSPDGIQRIHETLQQYKRVAEAISQAAPVRVGGVGSSPEIHEKIFQKQGVVVIFSPRRGRYDYVSQAPAGEVTWGNDGIEVCHDDEGRAVLEITFTRPGAKIIFFRELEQINT